MDAKDGGEGRVGEGGGVKRMENRVSNGLSLIHSGTCLRSQQMAWALTTNRTHTVINADLSGWHTCPKPTGKAWSAAHNQVHFKM